VSDSIVQKIRTITGKVVKAQQETYDSWTLFIEVASADKVCSPGQFLSIDPHQFNELADQIALFERLKGKKEPVRAYSVTSIPEDDYVAITIKPEPDKEFDDSYPPLLSNLLASNQLVGRHIQFKGYAGAHVLNDKRASQAKEVLHFVAGSGIVPNYSILRHELLTQSRPQLKHVMVYVNKSLDDIIFEKDLNKLAEKYSERFRLIHKLTRESKERIQKHPDSYKLGRPSTEFIKTIITNPKDVLVYACGPAITRWQKKHAQAQGLEPSPRFMESVIEMTESLGIEKSNFFREVYG